MLVSIRKFECDNYYIYYFARKQGNKYCKMGYKHIENLYKNPWFLAKYPEVYALEKIHGTSANITYCKGTVRIHPGGEKHDTFVTAFVNPTLEQIEKNIIEAYGTDTIVFYGEAYGGKQQKMAHTYGDKCKFVVFEVCLNNVWLDVEEAEKHALAVGFEFVYYEKGPNTEEWLDKQRDAPSVQAQRNGVVGDKIREGIVIKAVGQQTCMFKHKRPEFCETKSKRETNFKITTQVMTDAQQIVDEWVVPMRLEHVKDRIIRERASDSVSSSDSGSDDNKLKMGDMQKFMDYLIEDIKREAVGEVVMDENTEKTVRKFIGKPLATFIKKQ